MAVILIACVDSENGIAKNGGIPWNIPEDLKFFASETKGYLDRGRKNAVIMGKTTFLTLKKPLSDRVNFVVSRSLHGPFDAELKFYRSLAAAINDAKMAYRDVYIIGGESIYTQALEMGKVDSCVISRLSTAYGCDQFLDVEKYGFKQIKEGPILVNGLSIHYYA